VFKEGEPPLISLFAASRADDLPPSVLSRGAYVEPPLVIRQSDGQISHEYSVVRMSFGFPPGTEPA
jgi:hypothetical protein